MDISNYACAGLTKSPPLLWVRAELECCAKKILLFAQNDKADRWPAPLERVSSTVFRIDYYDTEHTTR